MRKFNYLSLFVILVFLVGSYNIYAKEKNKNGRKSVLNKTTDNPASSVVDINGITSWVGADGFHDWVVASSWNGAFPKGSNIGVIYAEGIVWGGQVHDGQTPVVRVNGNTYTTGCLPVTRLFRVRPDYQTGSLNDDAANFFNKSLGSVSQGDIDAVRQQYDTDWKEWPSNEGAPYEDVNGNGVYDPDPNGNGIVGEAGEDIPGIPGAAQTLFIKYNDNLSATNYGSRPIGLEVSEAYWAYAYTGALGNVIYKKVDIVYKGVPGVSASNSTIDSMYIVQWADPDVGNSTDDYAGCDTALNLGYAYTSGAEDAVYQAAGFKAPAVGYDFLQGVSQYTGNPSDSAIYNLKWRKGYKYVNPKPMSSFIYFAAGGNWSDPSVNYTGTLEFYNLMRGYLPEPHYPSASSFPEAVLDVTPFGKYLLDGDPVAGTGKIDGNSAAGGDTPGDRRIMVVNGPISMKLGDTAQVVLALIGGLGVSDPGNLSAVTELKSNDNTAQIVFDQLFQLPTLPPPDVNVIQMDDKIVLNWGSNIAQVDKIESFSSQGYSFEGYDVYQLPTPSAKLSEGVKLVTYDLINGITTILDTIQQSGVLLPVITEVGQDKGIKRYLEITKDPFRGGQLLRNGQEYYFAVVPYAFNPAPLLPFHALQSAVVIKVGVPQEPIPGVRYSSAVGDTVKGVVHTGSSDGSVVPIVVDPTVTTGDTYKITFASDGTWTLMDETTGIVKLSNQTNQAGDEDYKITDGILVKTIGPPVAINTWSFTPSADRWFTGNDFGGAQFFGGLDLGANFFGSNITPDQYVTVEVRFRTNADGQNAYRYLRGGTPSYSYQDYTPQHFTVWDVTSNPPRQLAAAYVEQNGNASANSLWEPTGSAADREYLFIFNTNYTEAPDPYFTGKNLLNDAADFPTLYALWPILRGTHGFEAADGQVFKIIPNFANTINDSFTFTAPSKKVDNQNLAKVDVTKINVFPNPYYGFQYRETSRDVKYVTFSHLPSKATIRIFDLSGVLVKTVNKNDPTQFTTWNLQNNDNYPVASGIYVVYIDMPELGSTKVLKLAVVQEEQILKVY